MKIGILFQIFVFILVTITIIQIQLKEITLCFNSRDNTNIHLQTDGCRFNPNFLPWHLPSE